MTNAAIYTRVSLDATGEALAVTRQAEDARKIAADRGWDIVAEYSDNSISASDKRKDRPGYNALVAGFERGEFDALICYDLDRLTRQPRQLEDWIDAAETKGLRLVTSNGEADLGTDGGQMFARIKAAVARAEVQRKGARQSRAQRQRAELGRAPAGVRLTGYTRHGDLVEAEAEVVRKVFGDFVAGDTLRGLARTLDDSGVPTRRGGSWHSSSVLGMLKNARYAGRSVLAGQVVGEAAWKPIVSAELFDAAQIKLSDPRRVTNRGGDTARKHLGSGVYFCTCGRRVRSSSSTGSGGSRYTCAATCFYRVGSHIDDFVTQVVRERLARADLADLLARPEDETELADLTQRWTALNHRLEAVAADYDLGLIDGQRFKVATDKVRSELEQVARRRAILIGASSPILAADDPAGAFDAASLDMRRHVVDTMVEVTLLPGARGRKGFDPESVRVTWR